MSEATVKFRPIDDLEPRPDREVLVLGRDGHWSVISSAYRFGLVGGEYGYENSQEYAELLSVRADLIGWIELSELSVEVLAPKRAQD